MKLEKRSAGTTDSVQCQKHEEAKKTRAPILGYILVLFIAAFFLMALSFLSHQRSNEQVLNQLSTNVNVLENLQSALEENARLQQQISSQKLQLEELEASVDAAQKALESANGEKTDLQTQLTGLQKKLNAMQQQMVAMDALAQVQRLFINSDLASCNILIADMEATGLDKLLPTTAASPVGVAPSQLFQQLKLLSASIPAAPQTAETPVAG